jgi:hypothetical protein
MWRVDCWVEGSLEEGLLEEGLLEEGLLEEGLLEVCFHTCKGSRWPHQELHTVLVPSLGKQHMCQDNQLVGEFLEVDSLVGG